MTRSAAIGTSPGIALGSYRPGQSSFETVGVYHPTWVEYAIVTGVLVFLSLLIVLGYRWLRIGTRDEEIA